MEANVATRHDNFQSSFLANVAKTVATITQRATIDRGSEAAAQRIDHGLDELGCRTRWRIVLVVQAQKGPAGTGRGEWSSFSS
jgi:hypothetical protein